MFLSDTVLETLLACPHVTALVTSEVLLWVTLTTLLAVRLVHNLPGPGRLRGNVHLHADPGHVVPLPPRRSVRPFPHRHQPFVITAGFQTSA